MPASPLATLSQLAASLLSPPTSPRARSIEHAALLLVAAAVTTKLVSSLASGRLSLTSIARGAVSGVLSAARALPGAGALLDAGLDAALAEVVDELAPPDDSALTSIPAAGTDAPLLLARCQALLDGDAARSGFAEGRSFSGVYHHLAGSLTDLQAGVLGAFINTNALYPGTFRCTRKFEAEAVAMTVNMLKGRLGLPASNGEGSADGSAADPAPDACGMLTTGGTESVLMAVKAYRDAAWERLGYVPPAVSPRVAGAAASPDAASAAITAACAALPTSPAPPAPPRLNVVAGITCHPALDKACHYFGIELRKLPVHPLTQRMVPAAVDAACDANTMLVYASAPTFPHGVVDPIPELAAAAKARGIPVHVDNCLGGVLMSYAVGLGLTHVVPASQGGIAVAADGGSELALQRLPLPAFDLRVPGVTSVSIDLHKYGCSPKGASVLVFADRRLRRYAYTIVTDWPGGLYATPTMTGSRSGANAAVAWATLMHMGGAGYAQLVAATHALHQRIVCALEDMGLRLVGTPMASVVAFTTAPSEPFNVHVLAARMAEKGWHLSSLQDPQAVQIVITERFQPVVDQWLADLAMCVAAARADPKNPAYVGKGDASIYGASAVLPGSEMERILQRYCDIMYMVRGGSSAK